VFLKVEGAKLINCRAFVHTHKMYSPGGHRAEITNVRVCNQPVNAKWIAMTYMFVQWTFMLATSDFKTHSSHTAKVYMDGHFVLKSVNKLNYYAVSRYSQLTLILPIWYTKSHFAVCINSKM
jgi:hypothetical protein